MESLADSSPRERPDVPADSTDQEHLVPSIYWITPQHVIVDVLELSDGLSAFSSVCNQYGLRTGECMSLKGNITTFLLCHCIEQYHVNEAYIALH